MPDFLNLQLVGKNPLNIEKSITSGNEQSKSTWVNQKIFSENNSNIIDNPYFINVDNYDDILASHIGKHFCIIKSTNTKNEHFSL
jgi:hypothetical protein